MLRFGPKRVTITLGKSEIVCTCTVIMMVWFLWWDLPPAYEAGEENSAGQRTFNTWIYCCGAGGQVRACMCCSSYSLRSSFISFLHLALKGSSEERLLRAGVFHCRVRLNSIAFSSPCPLFFLPFFEARHPGCQGTKMDGEQTRMENVWVVGGRRRRIVLNDVTSEKTWLPGDDAWREIDREWER